MSSRNQNFVVMSSFILSNEALGNLQVYIELYFLYMCMTPVSKKVYWVSSAGFRVVLFINYNISVGRAAGPKEGEGQRNKKMSLEKGTQANFSPGAPE